MRLPTGDGMAWIEILAISALIFIGSTIAKLVGGRRLSISSALAEGFFAWFQIHVILFFLALLIVPAFAIAGALLFVYGLVAGLPLKQLFQEQMWMVATPIYACVVTAAVYFIWWRKPWAAN